jgi:hypothetical protein
MEGPMNDYNKYGGLAIHKQTHICRRRVPFPTWDEFLVLLAIGLLIVTLLTLN